MTNKTPTDAEIDAIAESMPDGMAGFLKSWGWRKFARAVLGKLGNQAQAEEPMAWVWRFSDGSFCETPFETQKACAQDSIGYEGEPVPLYRAPQPVAREPLEPCMDNVEGINARLHFRRGWKAAEQAHGIKGGQHVGNVD